MTVSGGSPRFNRCWPGGAIGILCACALAVGSSDIGAASSQLEQALLAPIIEGEAAAGVRLGDDRETLAKLMGEPEIVKRLDAALFDRYVYSRVDPTHKSRTLFTVTFTVGQRGANSILIIDSRQPPTGFGYVGSTGRGYRMGEGATRLRPLHGEADVVIKQPPTMRPYYWYRANGFVASPEVGETDYTEAQIMVVKPNISREELERLLFSQ